MTQPDCITLPDAEPKGAETGNEFRAYPSFAVPGSILVEIQEDRFDGPHTAALWLSPASQDTLALFLQQMKDARS